METLTIKHHTLQEAAHSLYQKYQNSIGKSILGIGVGKESIKVYLRADSGEECQKISKQLDFPTKWLEYDVEVNPGGKEGFRLL